MLAQWLNLQTMAYKVKRQAMASVELWQEFETLRTDFPLIFQTYEDIWRKKLQATRLFMQQHKRQPHLQKEGEKFLANWLNDNLKAYKNN